DCLTGAVPNSYPHVDLLWDSVIAGPWGWARSTVQARVPARRLPSRRGGNALYATPRWSVSHDAPQPHNASGQASAPRFDGGAGGVQNAEAVFSVDETLM